MTKKWLSAIFIALFPAAMAVPLSAVADSNCVGSECEIIFSFTGQEQVFDVPPGAKNLSFQIFGASGGRGAAGGRVSGNITNPPETLYIYVGGAGRMGAGAQGGFNGGGGSGGNSGTEGSGGGATDIRLSQSLDSRIAVAGGGGGGGGEAGGAGGQGGDIFGGNGVSGQASGGGGGTPDRGGTAGASNGGFSPATSGSFGMGGRGGYSSYAGGGGGGGGWYGGGGGGSDDNTCCSDGGGGGGGSSYASTQYTSSISYQAGTNWGDGRAIIRYTRLPGVSTFELSQLSATTLAMSMQATEEIIGLTVEDFIVEGANCEITNLEVIGVSANATITGCDSGDVSLTLKPLSFGAGELGPAEPKTSQAVFDGDGPTFKFTSGIERTASASVEIEYLVSDNLTLQPSNFLVTGCELVAVTTSTLILEHCGSGEVRIALEGGSLFDQWQNRGPEADQILIFEVDQDSPEASWDEITVTGDGPFLYQTRLVFSEQVIVDLEALVFSADGDCTASSEVLETIIVVQAQCSYVNLNWVFTPGAEDLLGNQMPSIPLTVSITNPEPMVQDLPIQSPEVSSPVVQEPIPAAPVAPEQVQPGITIPEEEIVIPEPISAPDQDQAPIVETQPVESAAAEESFQDLVQAAPAVISGTQTVAPEPVETIEEAVSDGSLEQILDAQVVASPEQLIATPVIGLAPEEEPFQVPWLLLGLTLLVGLLGLAIFRFSGR